tara:strand:- start:22291 stop:23628 length:1338 start_codon:yes stop_codon:yes gene_type:complete
MKNYKIIEDTTKVVAKKRTEKTTEYNPTLILSQSFLDKVNFLHKQVKKDTEWSAILLYSTKEGSIDVDPNKWVISVDDCILMDVGTSAYTEYDMEAGDDYATDQWMDHLEKGGKIGHLHTHHNMKCYFSGTDMQELHDNSPQHNYYLSLIVNYDNLDAWCAKVAICGSETVEGTKQVTKSWTGAKGVVVQEKTEDLTKTEEVLYLMDCKITTEAVEPDGLQARLDSIMAKKEAKKPKYTSLHYGQNWYWNGSRQQSSFNVPETVKNQLDLFGEPKEWKSAEEYSKEDFINTDPEWNGLFDTYNAEVALKTVDLSEEEKDFSITPVVAEACIAHLLGQTEECYTNLEEVLKSLETIKPEELDMFLQQIEVSFSLSLFFKKDLTPFQLHVVAVATLAVLEKYSASYKCVEEITFLLEDYLMQEGDFNFSDVEDMTGVKIEDQYYIGD